MHSYQIKVQYSALNASVKHITFPQASHQMSIVGGVQAWDIFEDGQFYDSQFDTNPPPAV